MDEIFGREPHTTAYIDDVAIYSPTWEQHLIDVRNTLEWLRENGLTCKSAKCKFARRSLEFLGHKIGRGVISPLEAKVNALMEKTVPRQRRSCSRSDELLQEIYSRLLEDSGPSH
jgi:hypothetical protein